MLQDHIWNETLFVSFIVITSLRVVQCILQSAPSLILLYTKFINQKICCSFSIVIDILQLMSIFIIIEKQKTEKNMSWDIISIDIFPLNILSVYISPRILLVVIYHYTTNNIPRRREQLLLWYRLYQCFLTYGSRANCDP